MECVLPHNVQQMATAIKANLQNAFNELVLISYKGVKLGKFPSFFFYQLLFLKVNGFPM